MRCEFCPNPGRQWIITERGFTSYVSVRCDEHAEQKRSDPKTQSVRPLGPRS